MELEAAKILGKAIGAGIAGGAGMIGPGVGIGLAGLGALISIGRNPEVTNTLQTYMILAIAFAESLAIFALVISFLLLFAF
ncbi:MAG TPA: ATP synthase F0 subunit C [Thermoflexales bacterium]|jgi:F-type H+-transporting ATPase subunit c|nr:ATP synthase F0 subunit C [Thermoflexales bacterium]HQW36045.1 ATP synthase F0 subunit C [Thermoflexales bacterium]HQX76024.1 ATP synthase F0 subunit C [Thermoflexales bacterium]HQZ21164.1 ATP synthase F0 subunit C [Thermoflexales bacterium]HQZ98851.1 ATP synthase F0 subunit C [Thermoflexales bacterium]